VYVRDCTPAPPLALVLFCGGEVHEDATDKGVLTIDKWLRLQVPPLSVPMLLEMRKRLGRVLSRMVERSDGGAGGSDERERERDGEGVRHLVDAVIQLLDQPAEPAFCHKFDLLLNVQGGSGGESKSKKRRESRFVADVLKQLKAPKAKSKARNLSKRERERACRQVQTA
jgi:hypothetical protein